MASNFNDDLRDFLIIKSHYIQRLENGTVKDLLVPYKRARKTIKERLSILEARLEEQVFLQARIDRLNMELAEIDNILKIASIESAQSIDSIREEVAIIERDSLMEKLGVAYGKIGVDVVQLPYSSINFILTNPILGESIGDKLLWLEAEVVRKMKQELTQSIILGEDVRRATNRLLGVGEAFGGELGQKIINRASMIARTELLHVSNSINKAVFDENRDVIKGIEYVATLDKRTCPVCGPLDGTAYYYDADGAIKGNYIQLPQHPRCRCLYIPITYTWSELAQQQGIEIKGQTKKDYFSGWEEKTYTYNDWLKDQSEAFQKDVLGKTRYKMWIEGDIEFEDMPIQTTSYSIDEYRNSISSL